MSYGQARSDLVSSLDSAVAEAESGFDIDDAAATALEDIPRPDPPYQLNDLKLILQKPELLPQGVKVDQLGSEEFTFSETGRPESIRITTDPDFYEQHPESVEFWTPGNPLFPKPIGDPDASDPTTTGRLSDLLT